MFFLLFLAQIVFTPRLGAAPGGPPAPIRIPSVTGDYSSTFSPRFREVADRLGLPHFPDAKVFPPSRAESSTGYVMTERVTPRALNAAGTESPLGLYLKSTLCAVNTTERTLLLKRVEEGYRFFHLKDGVSTVATPPRPPKGAWVYVVTLAGQVMVSPYAEGGHRDILSDIIGESNPLKLVLYAGVLLEGPRADGGIARIELINNASGTFRCPKEDFPKIPCFHGLALDPESSK